MRLEFLGPPGSLRLALTRWPGRGAAGGGRRRLVVPRPGRRGEAEAAERLLGTWTRAELVAKLLGSAQMPAAHRDFTALNAHTTHFAAGANPRDPASSLSSAEIAASQADLKRTLVYSVGCQSGLSVPDEDALLDTGVTLDLAQAFVRRGALFVGNTGFGWATRLGRGLSEELAENLLLEALRPTATTVGKAFLDAKRRYLQERRQPDFYDEKILQEATFYGLPMYRVYSPPAQSGSRTVQSAPPDLQPGATYEELGRGNYVVKSAVGHAAAFGSPTPSLMERGMGGDARAALATESGSLAAAAASGLNYQELKFGWTNPGFVRVAGEGAFYHVAGITEVADGFPVLPKSVTGFPSVVRQPIFLSGAYVEVPDFDPVIAHAVNDSTGTSEEPAFNATTLQPQLPYTVQTLQQPAGGISQVLVVLAAQYRGSQSSGTLRRFTEASYLVYLSNAADQDLPSVGLPQATTGAASLSVTVTATDASGIYRVLLTYSSRSSAQEGRWQTVDLVPQSPGSSTYTGTIDAAGPVEYYVQVVDNAGNVNRSLPAGGGFYTAIIQGQGPTPTPAAGTSLAAQVAFLRSRAPAGVWYETAVTVRVYPANSSGRILDRPPVVVATTTTDSAGSVTVALPNLTPGSYDVNLKAAHALSIERKSVTLPAATALSFGTPLEGDADGDDAITILDFSRLASSFGRTSAQPGFRPETDFNQDGAVTILDFSLLASNFNRQGPVVQ